MEHGFARGLQVLREGSIGIFSGGPTAEFEWFKQVTFEHFARHTVMGDSCVFLKINSHVQQMSMSLDTERL